MKLTEEVQEAGYVLAILDFIKNNEESIDFDKLKLKFELHAIAWLLRNNLLVTDTCTFENSKESRVWIGKRAKNLYEVSWEKRMEIIKNIDEAE